jgi:hypothetical protein
MPRFQYERKKSQRLVFFTQEPPTALLPHYNMAQLTHFFNWTMTYRMDADIRLLYGRIIPKEKAPRTTEEVKQLREKARDSVFKPSHNKTKTIAWMRLDGHPLRYTLPKRSLHRRTSQIHRSRCVWDLRDFVLSSSRFTKFRPTMLLTNYLPAEQHDVCTYELRRHSIKCTRRPRFGDLFVVDYFSCSHVPVCVS